MFCNFLKFFSFLFLIINFSYAALPVADVAIVKGKVTKLVPGSLIASEVKVGDRLTQDTSVVTGDKSFIRITLIDNSIINLGPNSKIVIDNVKQSDSSKSVISLLQGKLRTSVEKEEDNKKKENKLIIKTRTAALGVRGTEFQTIYNPENKITNLLTFRGEVAMVNINDHEDLHQNEDVVEIERDSDLNIRQAKTKNLSESQINQLDKELLNKETVIVKAGQFSATTNELGNVSLPTVINQTQLGILYQNDTFLVKDAKESKIIKEASEIKKFIPLEQVPQATPPEGFFNEELKQYAPKSGGFIDMNTGLYVPPENDAIFDLEKNVYVPKASGKLEADTGEYIAPEGLKLTAAKGFVLTSRKGLKDDELVSLAKNMNTAVGKDLFIKKKVIKNLKVNYYSLRESFTRDQLELTLSAFSDTMDFDKSTFSSNNSNKVDGGKFIQISWLGASDGIYRPRLSLGYKAASYTKEAFDRDSSGLYSLGFGLDRYLTRRSFLGFGVKIHQELVGSKVTNGSNRPYFLSKATLTSLYLAPSFDVIKSQRYSVNLFGELSSNLYRNDSGVRVKTGLGTQLGLGFNYWYSKNNTLKIQFFSDNQFNKIEQDTESFDFTSNESGLRFVLAHIF